jgi:hypothetical protein
MDTVKICSKHDVLLERNKINKNFIISFIINNENVPLKHITDYSFFKVIADINKDVLEDIIIDIDDSNNNKANMFFLFKPVSKEFGILSKCMSVNMIKQVYDDTIIFETNNLDYVPDSMKCYDKILCKYSNLNIKIVNDNLLHLEYKFNIDINEELPFYMENMIGILMKKILLKTKVFIESIK